MEIFLMHTYNLELMHMLHLTIYMLVSGTVGLYFPAAYTLLYISACTNSHLLHKDEPITAIIGHCVSLYKLNDLHRAHHSFTTSE